MSNEYYEEGDKCMYEECNGHYQNADVEGCSCHINPPCSACINTPLECDKCKREAYD